MKEISLSGVFGWDITPEIVRSELKSANGGDIEISIASVGGSVFDGIDIYNQISNYKRKNPSSQIILKMTGVVASMAAYFAMNPAFDLIVAEDNAAFMIHNAWSFSVGDHNVLRKDADFLESLSEPMAKLVSEKMQTEVADAKKLLDAETWFFGQQIVDAGFASDIIERPSGGQDRDEVSAMAEMRKIQSEIMRKTYTQKAIASVTEPGNKVNIENNSSNQGANSKMNEKELRAEGENSERERVKALIEIKQKYEKTPSASTIAKIVDDAIVSGASKSEVLTDIQVSIANGNTLAALDSPGDTQQGFSTTVSGERGPVNHQSQFGGDK